MNNKQEIPKSTDVLVVGAGPTGMTLAISLKQLGLDCVVIDQLPGPPDDARAAFVQPRTLEYLGRIQVADPLIDDGLKGRGAAFADLERDLVRLSYETVDSPYPFLLMIPQSHTGPAIRGARRLGPAWRPPAGSRTGIPRKRCHRGGFHRSAASHQCPLRCRLRRPALARAQSTGHRIPRPAHRRRCSRCLT
jgi:hypothetical protein